MRHQALAHSLWAAQCCLIAAADLHEQEDRTCYQNTRAWTNRTLEMAPHIESTRRTIYTSPMLSCTAIPDAPMYCPSYGAWNRNDSITETQSIPWQKLRCSQRAARPGSATSVQRAPQQQWNWVCLMRCRWLRMKQKLPADPVIRKKCPARRKELSAPTPRRGILASCLTAVRVRCNHAACTPSDQRSNPKSQAPLQCLSFLLVHHRLLHNTLWPNNASAG